MTNASSINLKKPVVTAITGKGGSGKTTLAALWIHSLIRRGCRPVLAVDADPNTGLDMALGVTVKNTVGRVREDAREMAKQGMSAGISKQNYLLAKITESIVEEKDFDLIAMGRPEGPGCYCYANNILKSVLADLSGQYPFVVIDNEAGLENLSRRIYQQVSLLILVADPSSQGLATLKRLFDLAGEMDIRYDKLAVVINRIHSGQMPSKVNSWPFKIRPGRVLMLEEDEDIRLLAEAGRSLRELPGDNKTVKKVDRFLADMGIYS